MAKYVVIAPVIFVDTDSGRLRDRKKTEGAIVVMNKATAARYLEAGNIRALNPPKPKPTED